MNKSKHPGTPLTEDQLRTAFYEIAASISANPNADGWIRLCEILDEAMQDKRIISSAGALSFVQLARELAADSLTAATEREALSPLVKVLQSEAQSNNGRVGGSKPKPSMAKIPHDYESQYEQLRKAGKSDKDARSTLKQKWGVSWTAVNKKLKPKPA